MDRVHQLVGAVGSTALEASYTAYYASIAEVDGGGDGTVRHRLRAGVGDGTIEVTSLPGGFRIVRYDVEFASGHWVRYAFPGDHFEVEHCVDGRIRVSEASIGSDDLRARSVALSPRCAVDGVVAHGDGERYRGVSITGSWSGLGAYLGGHALPDNRSDEVAREQYLGRSAVLRPVAGPLEEIYLHRRSSPGRPLFLRSRLVAALAALVDALAGHESGAGPGSEPGLGNRALDDHEVAALRLVPELLWRDRHAPPTIAELARASSMSVRRLVTGFRMLYGTTVMEYHRRRCLDRAAALLVETDWPVARIGHEVGYASPSNFGYAFRRDRGITPARFRQAHS